MSNSNLLYESIFKRKLSAKDTHEYLSKITDEHPYFSPAQFFLLLHTEKGASGYPQQAAKTSILFNNPYWLQFQLQEKQLNMNGISDSIFVEDNNQPVSENQEIVCLETTDANETNNSNQAAHINQPGIDETVDENGTLSYNNELLPSQPQETANNTITETPVHDTVPATSAETGEQATLVNSFDPDNTSVTDLENNSSATNGEKEPDTLLSEPPVLSLTGIQNDTIKDSKTDKNENPVSSLHGYDDEIVDTVPSGHFNNENTPLVNETETEEEAHAITEQEFEPLHFKLDIDTTGITEDKIIFEPLHTSDYFASLGIKLSGDVKPSDRLGKQLKSFTEWLKTMKKIHNDQQPQQSLQTDLNIQKLAEQSNKKDEVLTEAMADVLLHQGRPDKAIEVYKKLSLLNPSKSAYFAAKIDQLKEH